MMLGPFVTMRSFSCFNTLSRRFQPAMMLSSLPADRESLSSRNRSGRGTASLPDIEAKESDMSPSLFVLTAFMEAIETPLVEDAPVALRMDGFAKALIVVVWTVGGGSLGGR
jgi:hypothetical protein